MDLGRRRQPLHAAADFHTRLRLESAYPELAERASSLTAPSLTSHPSGVRSNVVPAKRKGLPRARLHTPTHSRTVSSAGSDPRTEQGSSMSPTVGGSKAKRVRTGCLTCRERHLKCDEAVPDCNNCRRSNRECKRGLRLNFIDIQVKDLPKAAPTDEWLVEIQDESRQIASEYKGGLSRYPIPAEDPDADAASEPASDGASDLFLTAPLVAPTPQLGSSQVPVRGLITPPIDVASERDYIDSEHEIRFLQAFVDGVAVWMDLLAKDQHFTDHVPYMALKSSMLLNALLACGARHLSSLGSPGDEDGAPYHDAATALLRRKLQDPDCNRDECAVASVLLDVYVIMGKDSELATDRLVDTRSWIRRCGWDAASGGIGSSCFWVNICLEVLSCVCSGQQTAWDPDQWGLDLEFVQETSGSSSQSVVGNDELPNYRRNVGGHTLNDGADEEIWLQRIFYVLAKVANFHADTSQPQGSFPHDEQVRQQSRLSEWNRLKAMCDAWNRKCPRSMRPYGYSPTPSAKSLFPNVWLIKRSAKLGRMFYHTALCLLAQVSPLSPPGSMENRTLLEHHAHHVCGIMAHTDDCAVATVAIRGLAITSAVLVDRREQNEVLAILERIATQTGWRPGMLVAHLRRAWGWGSGADTFSLSPSLGSLPPISAAELSRRSDLQSGMADIDGGGMMTEPSMKLGWNCPRHSSSCSSASSSSLSTAAVSVSQPQPPLGKTHLTPPPAPSPSESAHPGDPYQGFYEPNPLNGLHGPQGLWMG